MSRTSLLRSFFSSVQTALFVTGVSVGMLVFAFTALETKAAVNEQVTYQAKLLDPTGTPVADNTYAAKFSLYDAPEGGSRIWTASGTLVTPTAISVTVVNGLFTVNLGDTSSTGGWQNDFTNVDWTSSNIYLGISIGSDSEMTPRRRLTSAPQAFNAERLQGMYASSGVATLGGSLFTINQLTHDSAMNDRTALTVRSQGTGVLDYLMKGINDLGATVFSVDRAGLLNSTGLVTTNATSTNLDVTGVLRVNSQLPCLADGTNCLGGGGGGGTDSRWTYNGTDDFLRMSTATTDLVFGSTATSTAPFYFKVDGASASSNRMIIGGSGNGDLVVGAATATNMGWGFTLDGHSAYVDGGLGIHGAMVVNGSIVGNDSGLFAGFVGSGTSNDNLTLRPDGSIRRDGTNSVIITHFINGGTVAGAITPDNDGWSAFAQSLGTSTARYNAYLYNVTSTNATTTKLYANSVEVGAAGVSSTGPVSVWGTSATSVFMGNVAIGTSTHDLPMHPLFTMDGNDLLVAGNIGSASSVYTNGAFVAGSGSTWFGNGFINKTDGDLAITASGFTTIGTGGTGARLESAGSVFLNGATGNYLQTPLLPTSDLATTIGNASNRFNGYFGSVTTTNVTTTNLYVSGNLSMTGSLSFTSMAATNVTSTNLDVTDQFSNTFNASTPFRFVSRLTTPAYHFARIGNRLYAGGLASGVNVYDMTSPSSPRLITNFLSGASISGLEVVGDRLLVGASTGSVIADVSDPAHIQVSPAFDGGGLGSYMVGGAFYHNVNYDQDIYSLDSSSTVPKYVRTISVCNNSLQIDHVVVGSLIYYTCATAPDKMVVVNAANPTRPVVVNAATGVTGAQLIAGSDHVLAVSTGTFASPSPRISFLPADGSSDLTVSSTLDLPPANAAAMYIASMKFYGSYLFVGVNGTQNRIYIVDVHDILNPRLLRSFDLDGGFGSQTVYDMMLYGHYLVYAGGSGQILIYDLGGTQLGSADAGYITTGGLFVENDAYFSHDVHTEGALYTRGGLVTNGDLIVQATNTTSSIAGMFYAKQNLKVGGDMVNVWDTATTSTQAIVTGFSGAPLSILAKDHYLYGGYATGLGLAYVKTPTVISFIGYSGGFQSDEVMAAAGSYIYGSGSDSSFYIYDARNKQTAPPVLGSVSLGCQPDQLLVHGAYVLAFCPAAIAVIDVSHPLAPVVRAWESVSAGAGGVFGDISGDDLYYASPGTFQIYHADLTQLPVMTPAPIYTSTLAINTVHAQNGGLYMTYDNNGGTSEKFSVLNLPGNAVTHFQLPTELPDTYQSFYSFGNYLFVVLDDGHVRVYDATNPFAPTLVTTWTFSAAIHSMTFLDGYAYLMDGSNVLHAVKMPSARFSSMHADTFTGGTIHSFNDATFDDSVSIGGSLTVGGGGIYSQGILGASASSTSSSAKFVNTASSLFDTSWGAYTNRLLVGNNDAATGTANYSAVITYAGNSTFGGLCIDDTSDGHTCPTAGITNTSILADDGVSSNAFDLAEVYSFSGSVEPGDVLVLDPMASSTVRKSTGQVYDSTVIGIVSTKPGFLLGWNDGAHVALSGRVPTKFSGMNGSVHVGDALTTSAIPGLAMKATKPGRIVGYALEDASVTSTIEVFVNVGYNAASVLQTDGTLATVTDDLTVMPQQAATALAPTQSSFGFTFRGSAWDGSRAITSDFHLANEVLSSTSSAFTIRDGSNTSLLALSNTGSLTLANDVSIGGKLYLSGRGMPQSSTYMFLDTSASPTSTYIATNADGWQANDSYDFAERYYSPDALEPGDLVVVSERGQTHVQRSLNATDMLVGIVSTKPAFVAGAPATSTYPIALAGRVPTKVSAINGSIKPGDPLAPSTVPGIAVKAVKAGPIVGMAMEAYDMSGIGKIEVNVNPTWWGGAEVTVPVAPTSTEPVTVRGFASIAAGSKRVHVSFASLLTIPNIQAVPYGETGGAWWIEKASDTGFDILMTTALPRDILWSWTATAIGGGEFVYHSDGTYTRIDPTTGVTVPGTQATTTVEVTPAPTLAPPPTPTPDLATDPTPIPAPAPVIIPISTEPIIAATTTETTVTSTEPAPIPEPAPTPAPIPEPSTSIETTSTTST